MPQYKFIDDREISAQPGIMIMIRNGLQQLANNTKKENYIVQAKTRGAAISHVINELAQKYSAIRAQKGLAFTLLQKMIEVVEIDNTRRIQTAVDVKQPIKKSSNNDQMTFGSIFESNLAITIQ